MDVLSTISTALVLITAGLHFWFMVLEIFLWQKPLGLNIFRMSADQARLTATLAANQGFYNAILAAGLLFALLTAHTPTLIFFLSAVILAGLFGACTVSRKIFFIQSLPALLALLTLFL